MGRFVRAMIWGVTAGILLVLTQWEVVLEDSIVIQPKPQIRTLHKQDLSPKLASIPSTPSTSLTLEERFKEATRPEMTQTPESALAAIELANQLGTEATLRKALKLSTLFRNDIQNPTPPDSISFWRALEETLYLVKETPEFNPVFEEFKFYIQSHGLRPDKVRGEAQSWLAMKPDSGIPYYFLAHTEAVAGRFAEARELLQEAIQRDPKNLQFASALEKLNGFLQSNTEAEAYYIIDMAELIQ